MILAVAVIHGSIPLYVCDPEPCPEIIVVFPPWVRKAVYMSKADYKIFDKEWCEWLKKHQAGAAFTPNPNDPNELPRFLKDVAVHGPKVMARSIAFAGVQIFWFYQPRTLEYVDQFVHVPF